MKALCYVLLLCSTALAIAAEPHSSSQHAFFNKLADMCGTSYQGYSSFPDDPEHDFHGKLLVAHIDSCSENEIRIPFSVAEDKSRTWVIRLDATGLSLKHDHRHADGSPDDVTNYGGTAASGSAFSQSFPADGFTAELIPAASTNVWTISLDIDAGSLTYYLERNKNPRFKATLLQLAR